MATSGNITGAFSGWSSAKGYPYISWSITQDITGNYSDVTAVLHFVRVGSYFSYNLGGFPNTGNINGVTQYSGSTTYDLRSGAGDYVIRTITQRVYHNSDGSKSCWIGWDGDTETSTGTFNFGATVTFDTIPREAYITNNVDFEIENDIPITLWNDGNQYVKTELYINGTLIQTDNFGQVTSATITLDSTDDANIYAETPNATSVSGYIRVKTYSDSGYTTQIGSNKDKTLTASVNQTANKPTFLDFDVANLDKNVEVIDKYSNSLVTSSTSTLLGGNTRMIKGVSKVRATVAVADKMTALNSATEDKYRFFTALQQVEENYSAVADVNLDLDNVQDNDFTVSAYDSRSLSTDINKTLAGGVADYFEVSVHSMVLARDNNVDALTKLQFSGEIFNEYFGGGAVGVENALTCDYRYKLTTDTWGSQTWTSITPTVDGSGNITFDDYINGDLGALGFDTEKSFDIEVRAYDKLSVLIIEKTLSRGIPLMDFTQNGVSIGAKYDATEGGLLQVQSRKINIEVIQEGLLGNPPYIDQTLTYASSTTVTITGDWTDKIHKGAMIEFTQSGTVKYGYINNISYSSPSTTLTIKLLNTATGTISVITNTAISDVYISNSSMLRNHPQWLNFTPSWTNLTVGNGTNSGKICMVGRTVHFKIFFQLGSTSSVGSYPKITLPITPHAFTSIERIGQANLLNQGVAYFNGVMYETGHLYAENKNGSGTFTYYQDITAIIPFTWGSTDIISVIGTYMAS